MKLVGFLLPFLCALLASGCGYGFQSSRSAILEQEGIRRVYVAPISNSTYKAGVENMVYNSLLKMLAVSRRLLVVSRPEEADARLEGLIAVADSTPNPGGEVPMNRLNPPGVPTNDAIRVSMFYTASLNCSFALYRRNPPPGKKEVVWSGGFTRSKTFPAATQLGVLGTTSALINSSEFDRALSDLADSMMVDVHESMLAMF